MANILVIDDDENILEVIRARLEANGYFVETRAEANEALEVLKERPFDLVITDIRMPGMDGIELLRRIKCLNGDVPVILLTAYGTIAGAVEAVKLGAYQYFAKPFDGKRLVEEVRAALEALRSWRAAARTGPGTDFPGVYGESPAMRELYPRLVKFAGTDSTVLIQGESGTGKELVAQMIHRNGPRCQKRFVILDCGATPATLIESELFGHVRGSFTNATESRKGLFEAADGGTLLLDEVGSMPLDLQTRLLRVLQEGAIRRLGENQMRRVDVRVLAATNADLEKQVEAGRFRLDLYYRLAVLRVVLPPLRERAEDIPLLAEHFLRDASARFRKGAIRWGEGALDLLCGHAWPGNVRELKNVVEAAVVLSEGGEVKPDALASAGFRPGGIEGAASRVRSVEKGLGGLRLPEYLQQRERSLIVRALEQNRWVQKDAAHQLGISPRMLHYKIRKMKIRSANPKAPPPEDS